MSSHRCRENHVLTRRRVNYAGGRWTCDMCMGSFPTSAEHLNCAACQYDVCASCESGTGNNEFLMERVAEELAISVKQASSSSVVHTVSLRFDSDGDLVELLATRDATFRIVLVTQVKHRVNWSEAQALRDMLRKIERGDECTLLHFAALHSLLESKYRVVLAPTLPGAPITLLVYALAMTLPKSASHVRETAILFDERQDLLLQCVTGNNSAYFIRVCIKNNASFGLNETRAIADAVHVFEPGDVLNNVAFLGYCAQLRNKYKSLKVTTTTLAGFTNAPMAVLFSTDQQSQPAPHVPPTPQPAPHVPPAPQPPTPAPTRPVPAPVPTSVLDESGCPGFPNVVRGSTRKVKASGQAVVYRGKLIDRDIEAAIKVYHSEDMLAQCKAEFAALRQAAGHPNLTEAYAMHERPLPCIVMRFVNGDNLREHINKHGSLRGADLRTVCVGIARAIARLHELNLGHRDVKSANVMLERINGVLVPVLVDLGTCAQATVGGLQTTVTAPGTLMWMAPEALDYKWCFKSDVYSFGIVMWEAATGKFPYDDTRPMVVIKNVKDGERPDINDVPADAPAAMRALILRCWSARVEDRPDMNECVRLLNVVPPAPAPAPVPDTSTMTTTGAVEVACFGLTESMLCLYDTPKTVTWLTKLGIAAGIVAQLDEDGVTGEVLVRANDDDIKEIFPSAIARRKIVMALQFVKANR